MVNIKKKTAKQIIDESNIKINHLISSAKFKRLTSVQIIIAKIFARTIAINEVIRRKLLKMKK